MPFFMNNMIVFKPQKAVAIMVAVLFMIGLAFPFLIYTSDESFRTRELVAIWVISSILFFAGIKGLLGLKTIAFDQDYWTVSYYLLPARKMNFHIGEIAAVQKRNYFGYRPRIPVTTFFIQLKNARKIEISSTEITDFEQLEELMDRPGYLALRQQNK